MIRIYLCVYSTLSSSNIIMRIGTTIFHILFKRPHFFFSQAKPYPFPLSLAYPFDYTLTEETFALHDIRFTEMPINRPLSESEQEHMVRVLSYLTGVVSGREKKREETNYVWGRLLEKGRQLGGWLREGKIEI